MSSILPSGSQPRKAPPGDPVILSITGQRREGEAPRVVDRGVGSTGKVRKDPDPPVGRIPASLVSGFQWGITGGAFFAFFQSFTTANGAAVLSHVAGVAAATGLAAMGATLATGRGDVIDCAEWAGRGTIRGLAALPKMALNSVAWGFQKVSSKFFNKPE